MGTEPADIWLRRGHKQYGAELGLTRRKSARQDAEDYRLQITPHRTILAIVDWADVSASLT